MRIHPQGRLLATAAEGGAGGGGGGVRLWDIFTGREVAHISTADSSGILFRKGRHRAVDLRLLSTEAMAPWSSRAAKGRKRVRIGPPQRLLTLNNASRCGHMGFCGPDQKRLAIGDFSHGRGVNLIDLAPRPARGAILADSLRRSSSRPARTAGGWHRELGRARLLRSGTPGETWQRAAGHGGRRRRLQPGWPLVRLGNRRERLYRGGVHFLEGGDWERGPSIPLERTTSPVANGVQRRRSHAGRGTDDDGAVVDWTPATCMNWPACSRPNR